MNPTLRLVCGALASLAVCTVQATDGTTPVQMGTWTTTQMANNGLFVDPVLFANASWSWERDGKGLLCTLLQDVAFGDADGGIIKANSFLYYIADPVLNYSFSIVDIGAPSTFGFSVTGNIVPVVAGPHTFQMDLVTGMTDGPDAGSSVSLTAPVSGSIQTLSVSGASTGNVFVPAPYALGGSEAHGTSGGTSYAPITDNLILDWDTWRLELNFTGSGGGDAYAITGRVEITPVPVPAAVWLLGSALLGSGAVVRRRR